MPTIEEEFQSPVDKLLTKLGKRSKDHKLMDSYYEANSPLPTSITRAGLTNAYNMLMPMASSNWAGLIVDSVQDRLEISSIRSEDQAADKAVWEVWQNNWMDAESKLGHNAALVSGRCHALVWPGDDGKPAISLDDAATMVVKYKEGSRRERVSALRRWTENGRQYCTLYGPNGIYKFQEAEQKRRLTSGNRFKAGGVWWERREEDEVWPLANPYKKVPVVEVAVNRRLKPGPWPYARGEFQNSIGHIDRINTLTFLGLVVAFFMGFPIRVLIGDKIIKDDTGAALPPFKNRANEVVQFEDPEVELKQFDAADLKNLSVVEHVEQLATITKTPRHYFPLGGGISNLSADAIRASEGGLNAKVKDHKASEGEGWEEVLRLGGMMLDSPVELSPSAEVKWMDHESRSLAERVDAAAKLSSIDGVPWQLIAEKALNLTQDEIARAEASTANDALTTLMRDVNAETLTPPPPAAIPTNGGR